MNNRLTTSAFGCLVIGFGLLAATACTNHTQDQSAEHDPGIDNSASLANSDPANSDQVKSHPETETANHQAVQRLEEATLLSAGARVAAGKSRQLSAPPAYPSIAQSSFRLPSEPLDRENYAHIDENGVRLVSEQPVSTFSLDVDTASYSNIRRFLNAGQLPPMDAVRIEEMINYFDYSYQPPRDRTRPFSATTTLATAPWDTQKRLLRIGIQGYEVEAAERPASNLVFLVDVSGSMNSPDKIGLLKKGLILLGNQLTANDRVSLVVYAGASGVVLQPTPGDQVATIRAALEQLSAGGSTNGAAGIRLAYDMARQAFIKDGINRVILATDGDFNVGTVNFEQLVDMVERERASGISLTTLGFGSGNYNDHLMEQLADKGNGNYAYIDTIREANKVLVEEMGSTLQTIAADVKVQIEFNPAVVAEYRLIGYENRLLNREDFNNDKVDAGEVGAGHSVTALYEIVYVNSEARQVDPLRYGDESETGSGGNAGSDSNEMAFLKMRYKLPGESSSRLISQPIARNSEKEFRETDADFRFAAAVAAFGQQLRGSKFRTDFDLQDIRELAAAARGADRFGYRGEFLSLVSTAEALSGMKQQAMNE